MTRRAPAGGSDVRRDYFRRLWEQRYRRDDSPAPRPPRPGGDGPNTRGFPPRGATPGVITRPGHDGPGRPGPGGHDGPGHDGPGHHDPGNKHDDHGSWHGGWHGGGSGGWVKPVHHYSHWPWYGCSLWNWPRLLCGYIGFYSGAVCSPWAFPYFTGTTSITYNTYDWSAYPPSAGTPPPPCVATPPEAWTLLADGQAAAAREAFECLTSVVPDDGYLLTGLALSAAATGDDDDAVTALRAAMRLDPVSLLDVPAGDALDATIAAAAERYDAQARSHYGDVDALFMVAAMRYLLGEDRAAGYAIEVAMTLGDDDLSTRNLKGLMDAAPADPELRRAE